MNRIKLGAQGLEVSQQGLGCMGMSEYYGETNEEESIATMQLALDSGITFFDTADVYGPFTNEVLVGNFIRERRNQIELATKFGGVRAADGTRVGINGTPQYVREACDASLGRLRVEHIDLYYLHRVDPATPIEETVGAMGDLVKAGKVRYIGISEASLEDIRRAHATHPISALQTEYSLWSRDPEADILPLCRELGIGFVAYSPLGRGFLTGAIKSPDDFAQDDFRRHQPRFQGENFAKNLELVAHLDALASRKGCTAGQLALAWTMSQDGVVPIPGTKRRTYLAENAAAAGISLTRAELEEIDAIVPPGSAAGTRYVSAQMPVWTSPARA